MSKSTGGEITGKENNESFKESRVSPRKSKIDLTTAKRSHTRAANLLLDQNVDKSINLEYLAYLKEGLEDNFGTLNDKFADFLESHDKEDEGEIDLNADNHERAMRFYFAALQKFNHQFEEGKMKTVPENRNLIRPKVTLPDMSPFTNNIRDYAAFKGTFRNQYEPYYGELAAVILKEKLLKDHSKNMCRSLDSTDEIFRLLDHTYGDHGKLAESVLADIQNLQPCRLNVISDLRTLLQTVQLAELDLKRVHLEHHICQYFTVTIICDKLPLDLQRRWAYEIARNEIPTVDRYTKILEFLKLEVRACELYSSGNVDNPNTAAPENPMSARMAGNRYYNSPKSNGHESYSPDTSRVVRFCPVHPDQEGHGLARCMAFRRMSTEEKVKIFECNTQFCRSCLDIHEGSKCRRNIYPCLKEDCGKRHYSVHHEACVILSSRDQQPHAYAIQSANHFLGLNSISPGQRVRIPTARGTVGLVNTLWDNGSNVTLILKSVCSRFGLHKVSEASATLEIETVGGGTLRVESETYEVPLFDLRNKLATTIHAYAVNKIGNDLCPVDLTQAFQVFGIRPPEQGDMTYPSGSLEMLIGADNAHLVLHHVTEVNGLRLSSSVLGQVIWGRLPNTVMTSQLHSRAILVSRPKPPSRPITVPEDMVPLLFATEVMGVQCQPNCGACACD